MLIEFPEFESFLLDHHRKGLLLKGKQFLDQHRIKHIHAFSGTEWDVFIASESGRVPGYTVRIKVEDGRTTCHECNCPGYRIMPLCKHIIAALYGIRESKLYDPKIGEYETGEVEEEQPDFADEEDKEEEKQKPKETETIEKKGEHAKKRKTNRQKNRLESDLVDKELLCQICGKSMENPVLLPCQGHSACKKCVDLVLENNDQKLVCSYCGVVDGGDVRRKEIKINRGLEKVRHAYEKERQKWSQERERLEKEMESLRASGKEKEKKKSRKKGGDGQKIIDESDKENLKKRGKNIKELEEKNEEQETKKEKKKTAFKTSNYTKRTRPEKRGKRQGNMEDEANERLENYELRQKKKIKTHCG